MKPFYRSKTVWVNVIGAGAMLLHGPLGSVLPTEYAAVAIALLNLALRFTTTQAVTLK
jgi:hypothetical protein